MGARPAQVVIAVQEPKLGLYSNSLGTQPHQEQPSCDTTINYQQSDGGESIDAALPREMRPPRPVSTLLIRELVFWGVWYEASPLLNYQAAYFRIMQYIMYSKD